MEDDLVAVIQADAYSLPLDDQLKLFKESEIKEIAESILQDPVEMKQYSADELMTMAAFLKALYIMDRLVAERRPKD